MATLVDSCVLLDVIENDKTWSDWSVTQLEKAAAHGSLVINVAVYAEIANSFESESDLNAFLRETGIQVKAIPKSAAWLAAKAHQKYRRSKGAKTTTLPDFFIGAHARIEGIALLTRDATRFSTYFPQVNLIVPSSKT
jgi:predicted nucleic acid-binding protein